MTLSTELGEVVRMVGELGLDYHFEKDWVVVSFVSSVYPGGVEFLKLRQDRQGFDKGAGFGSITAVRGEEWPKTWDNLPAEVAEFLAVLNSLGLRLVARKDNLERAVCYYIATDGFRGGDTLGGENGENPSLVLIFDESGKPWRWGVYRGGGDE